MIKMIIVLLATLIPLAPFVMYFVGLRNNSLKATRNLVVAFKSYNVFLALMGLGIIAVWLISPDAVLAAGKLAEEGGTLDTYDALAAGIATGLAALGAGVAVSGTGAAAIGAISEKPEMLGRSLIFVGLAEGVAIYGLLIAFLVLFS
jgi:V/A-type H+-transporting ATPase subunit K